MPDVICPNCHSMVRPWLACSNCGISFPKDRTVRTIAAHSETSTHEGVVDLAAPPNVQMDAHLHRVVGALRSGRAQRLPTSSTQKNEVAVIACVKEVAAFSMLNGVRVSSKPVRDEDGNWLVTARITVNQVEETRKKEFVKSLKASQRLRPCLERTLAEIGSNSDGTPSALLDGSLGEGGKGVIVGIIDFGMDFAHKNFLNANDNSRVLAIWDQTTKRNPKSPKKYGYDYDYGTLHTQEDINAALQHADPYKALRYGPFPDDLVQTGAHGTYVADAAAGNGNASVGSIGKGVAPNADIVFVEASTKCVPTSDAVVGNSFGDSVQLAEAIKFIFAFAEKHKKPCVINLSMGTNGGPHDGTTLVEKWIDGLVSQAPNRAVVIAAANMFGKKLHATGTVSAETPVELKWQIFPNDSTNNEMEIWYSKEDRFDVEVIKPGDATPIAGARFRETREFPFWEHSTIVVANRHKDSCNDDNTINIFLDHELSPGIWTIRLIGASVKDGSFHAWIERDEKGPSQFKPVEPGDSYQIDDAVTLGSIACGKNSIVVGSYDAHQPGVPLSGSSSSGRTRNGCKKPELSAPGEHVLAAYSGTRVRRNTLSGTSMSAPAVTGVVALMLAEARSKGASLSAKDTREILIRTARKDPPSVSGDWDPEYGFWHPRYGFGRVSAPAAVAAVRALAAKRRKKTKGPAGNTAKRTKSKKTRQAS
jgi:subtilisin family serine protease